MGDIGICSLKEDAINVAVGDVYRRITITISHGWLNYPNIWTRDGAEPSIEPSLRVSGHDVFSALREAASTDKEADRKTPSWGRIDSSTHRKIDDTTHLTMVSGSIFSRYVEYVAPSTVYIGSVFLRESIARSRSRGDLQYYTPI